MLAEILHKVAQQEYQEKGNSNYRPRPSLAGPEKCIRQMVYWRLKTPATPLPGRGVMIFDDSTWHEELTAEWIRKSSYKLHSKDLMVKVNRGYPFELKGKIDGIVENMQGKEYLLEHKAISHFSWMPVAKGEPPLDNLAQDCVYLDGLKDIDPEINESLLLLKNKNTAQYVEFLVEYQRENDLCIVKAMIVSGEGMTPIVLNKEYPNIVENAFAKFQKVEECAVAGELPLRQYEKSHWRCDYCRYHEVCWAKYEEEFQVLGTEADLSDIEDLLAYYLETSGHISEMKKEHEGLKTHIKGILLEKKMREGTTERYIVKNSLIKSVRIDKTLIPPNILPMCQKEGFYEKLTINLKKGVKENARGNVGGSKRQGSFSHHKRNIKHSYKDAKLPDSFRGNGK